MQSIRDAVPGTRAPALIRYPLVAESCDIKMRLLTALRAAVRNHSNAVVSLSYTTLPESDRSRLLSIVDAERSAAVLANQALLDHQHEHGC